MSSCVLTLCLFVCTALAQRDAYKELIVYKDEYELPSLPYGYGDLEPNLDEATLRVHHLGHHKAYANKMNAALKDWREKQPSRALAHASIVEILQRISEVPSEWRTTLKNNGGGFVNHVFYWSTMCPPDTQVPEECQVTDLEHDIERDFGSFQNFEEQFSNAAATLFGSGYAWLVEDRGRQLSIITLPNQDSPLSLGLYPLLVLDVWEHAYYLKHQNMRGNYISDWKSITCFCYVQNIRDFWREAVGTWWAGP